MNKFSKSILKVARRMYPLNYSYDGQLDKEFSDRIVPEASELIYRHIISEAPLMVSRFGSIELNCIINYLDQKDRRLKYLHYIQNKTRYYEWDLRTLESMCTNAGFFPFSYNMLEEFCELMLEDMQYIDVLGSWLKEESRLADRFSNVQKIGLLNLEPYNHNDPWSRGLEGKKVLVVHPFAHTIKEQYQKRKRLFVDNRVLPEFELKVIQAVQSIAGNKTVFDNWFEALNSMKEEIDKVDFEVAIIGCGAYGMPLAAHIKRMGKKAVHLGGATQLLFGIKGKRWEEEYYDYKSRLFNENWTKPYEVDVPQNFLKVEDGCYW